MLPPNNFFPENMEGLPSYFAFNAGISVVSGIAGGLCHGRAGVIGGISIWAITAVARAVFHQITTVIDNNTSLKLDGENNEYYHRQIILSSSLAVGSVSGLYVTQLLGRQINYNFRATPILKSFITPIFIALKPVVIATALVGISLGAIKYYKNGSVWD